LRQRFKILLIGLAGGWSKGKVQDLLFKNTTKKTTRLIVHLKQNKSLERFHKVNKFWFDFSTLDILHEKNHLGAVLFRFI
jgi:lycopene beta-cyclase